jgi:hypothetical protein
MGLVESITRFSGVHFGQLGRYSQGTLRSGWDYQCRHRGSRKSVF